MLKKEYISINKLESRKTRLPDNTIIISKSIDDLNRILCLSKKNSLNIKSIQINSSIINKIHKDTLTEFKKTFKYISIIYTENLTHKLSNQNIFLEIIIPFNEYKKNKDNVLKDSPNRIILDFYNLEIKKNIRRSEIIDILNELLSNKIYPLTKNIELDKTLPEHMYELFSKTISKEQIKNSKLDTESKDEIIKFLEIEKIKLEEKNNERIINRI